MLGQSIGYADIRARLDELATKDSPVVITGEPGTGKISNPEHPVNVRKRFGTENIPIQPTEAAKNVPRAHHSIGAWIPWTCTSSPPA